MNRPISYFLRLVLLVGTGFFLGCTEERPPLAIAYNYCTLSYTMAYWDKAEWEVELDRLAAAGYNAALLTKGLDKVWDLTLREMGYPEESIRAFIASDAYQAWWHMGNLEGAGGPVPKAEIEHNAELGRWLYAEMKRRGIEPMVQAFVGLVPHDSPATFPVFDQGKWCQVYRRPSILDPRSPEFARFSEVWYENLRKVYDMDHSGAAKFLVGDLFHEGGQAGTLTDAEIARVGAAIQDTQKRHFGDAVVWVLQAWQINPAQKALMRGLSPRNTLIEHLDKHMGSTAPLAFNLANERGEQLPWVWAEVSNFGGNTGMRGALTRFRTMRRIDPACRAAFRGYALLSEGLETNEALYRLFEAEMTGKTYDFADYPQDLVNLLAETAWTQHTTNVTEGCVENILCAWPSFALTTEAVTTWGTRTGTEYDPKRLRDAARVALNHPELPRQFTVELFMQLVADRAREIIAECETSAARRAEFLKLLDLADRLASCSDVWRLDWQESRRHGHAAEYRTLLTSWTGDLDSSWASGLHEYAHRAYSGLLRHYYLPRWQWFFDYHEGKLSAEQFIENCRALDRTFPSAALPPPPEENLFSLAEEILNVVE